MTEYETEEITYPFAVMGGDNFTLATEPLIHSAQIFNLVVLTDIPMSTLVVKFFQIRDG